MKLALQLGWEVIIQKLGDVYHIRMRHPNGLEAHESFKTYEDMDKYALRVSIENRHYTGKGD